MPLAKGFAGKGEPMVTLHPMILAVPQGEAPQKGRAQVSFLSAAARLAARLSAEKIGGTLGRFPKDANGVPGPEGGLFWSLSHKVGYVAGVAGPIPVGIDVERIRPVRKGMWQRLAGDREWSLAAGRTVDDFYRYWTAKEAVLKKFGSGIGDLRRCKIHRLLDNHRMVVYYKEGYWLVEHLFLDGHVAAVVKGADRVRWHIGRLPSVDVFSHLPS